MNAIDIRHLSSDVVRHLAVILTRADLHGSSVRVTVDGGFKISVAQGMWTAPMGEQRGN